jgi:hypothetical protein
MMHIVVNDELERCMVVGFSRSPIVGMGSRSGPFGNGRWLQIEFGIGQV